MQNNRRLFFKQIGASVGALTIGSSILPELLFGSTQEANAGFPPADTSDQDFWAWVQESYTTSPNIINLNNGGVSPQPKVVQDTVDRYYHLCNEGPSYYMWRILDQGREPLRNDLAEFAGCSPAEIAIDRNTTEAMNSIIFGLQLNAGDEVVLTKQDYPNVINSWKLREKRDGIVLKWVNLELPSEDEAYLVNSYVNQFTEKTKVVNVTHIINWIGQIIPVQKIAKEAHKKNIDVLVDGAHSFALLDFKIPDLECDYFGTSLHKWMCAPFGSGLLYVKKEKIGTIYFSDDKPLGDDIRKFERLGTRNFATELGIGSALDFHLAIGSKRKEDRLRFLKNYWANKVKDLPGVHIKTSFDPRYSCAVCLVSIDGLKPGDFSNMLYDEFKIHTTSIEWENISGVRVSPNVYTNLRDLDKFVKAIDVISKKKR
ncbi:MAG: aminotransferase class V-fold PLP-dependent enzyme [Bacteroidota bacterium]